MSRQSIRPTPILAVTALILCACGEPPETFQKSGLSPEESYQIAEKSLDYDQIVTNEFIPDLETEAEFDRPPAETLETVEVGLSWVANDQFSPWILGQELGFFEAEGIDLVLVEGGPGRDHLINLISGQIDIFIGAAEPVLQLQMSPTGADIVMLGATMKGSSAGWVMLDDSIPNDQRSDKEITADDLRGKRIGIQGGAEFYTQFVCDRLGIDPSEFTILTAGANPDALISGAMDFFQCWIVNQPRILERAGYKNWAAITFNDLGFESYNDISVVTLETYEKRKDLLARYMRALARSMAHLVADPEGSAEVVAAALDPVYNLSKEDIIWRMEREIPIYKGDGSEPLLRMNPEKIKRLVALLIEYGQIDFTQ